MDREYFYKGVGTVIVKFICLKIKQQSPSASSYLLKKNFSSSFKVKLNGKQLNWGKDNAKEKHNRTSRQEGEKNAKKVWKRRRKIKVHSLIKHEVLYFLPQWFFFQTFVNRERICKFSWTLIWWALKEVKNFNRKFYNDVSSSGKHLIFKIYSIKSTLLRSCKLSQYLQAALYAQ